MNSSAILLSDPDITAAELEAVSDVMQSPSLSGGPKVEEFEAAFAAYLGRKYAVAVASGTLGLLEVLRAYGIGAGDEVIASAYSFRETAHAITLAGAMPVFADIDYWSGTIVAEKVQQRITPKTRAIVAGNTNGHPAPWEPLREVAKKHNLPLIEDSTEAIGSTYKNALVGTFGDCAVFDFSQPSPLACGEGAMVVTDNTDIAAAMRQLCSRRPQERASVVGGSRVPHQAKMSDLAAAVGLVQLRRINEILAKRKRVEALYFKHITSFEGIKNPYNAPEATDVHGLLYLVHMGTRFSRSSRDAIVEDLKTENVEATAYCCPLHEQRHYVDLGYRRGNLLVTEKIADRGVALPFHTHLTEERIAFIVSTMKDASINVGAGSAIY
jgi:dTDP-4-amino-4,6-dideoxygalactose transaminase